ncbi:hypothetical protein GE21DRAFT_1123609 [Neurospora crassa]|nr:hypothetical protein GE21DRAFT_1123609 [Neurospora crassa]
MCVRVRGAVSYRLFPLYRRWSLQFIMIGCYGPCSCSSLFISGYQSNFKLGDKAVEIDIYREAVVRRPNNDNDDIKNSLLQVLYKQK